jgi:hypothetical protein
MDVTIFILLMPKNNEKTLKMSKRLEAKSNHKHTATGTHLIEAKTLHIGLLYFCMTYRRDFERGRGSCHPHLINCIVP